VSQDHEYMDTGALTPDAVPEPAVEAPGSPSKAAASAKGAGQSDSGVPDTSRSQSLHVAHTYVHPSVSRETHVARPHTTYSGSASAWAHQYFSVRVANCESGGGPNDHHTYYDGNPHLSDPNGHYGKWQFAPSTWYSVGGTGNAAYASEAEQDYRAWLLWKRDGWGQWECASMV
jgi:hypothetical protein